MASGTATILRAKPTRQLGPCVKVTWIFLGCFAFTCFLFWWLPTVLFRYLLHTADPVGNWVVEVSLLSLIIFTAGYLVPPMRFKQVFPLDLIDTCEDLAYKLTWWLALPAFVLSVQWFISRAGTPYGEGEMLPFLYQAVFYVHMFFAFMFISAARTIPSNRWKVLVAALLVSLPRLFVSLRGGRFFLAQALIPIVLIALSRGWLRFSGKRFLELFLLATFVIFVPAFTRGDNVEGQDALIRFFEAGSSLRLFQDNLDLDLTSRCPPLLVSLTAKLIPYNLLGVCTLDIYGINGVPATLDRILTVNDPSTEGTGSGTGGNYLLELYVTGGLGAVILGAAFLGFSSRCFVRWIADRSLFGGVWAECLSRVLFAPREDFSYVYERIPSLIAAILVMILMVWIVRSRIRITA